ncbi:MAG TPA: hypothetical protein O0X43_02370 [Methanocorpusculum sp.]|nr:hypothetical protein [Methanocorpusculum sp.]
MDLDSSLGVLLVGIVVGWIARMVWARNYTLSSQTPAAARETLKTIAAAVADGRITAEEVITIAQSLLRTATTIVEKK